MTAAAATASQSRMGLALAMALPIGLSAFLLFTIEPLVGRLLLPAFGGGPMAWTGVLCFFQVVLLGGYAYGHLSMARLGQWGPPVHLVLAALALFALVQAPATVAGGSARSAIDVAWVLAGIVGLPVLVIAASTPLLSGWLGAADRSRAGGVYWLYWVANAGALLALLVYPLLIEPRVGLATQRLGWTIAFFALVLLLARAVLLAMRGVGPQAQTAWIGLGETQAVIDTVNWPRRGRWLLLAAVPSGLLAAVTTFIATDLGSMPVIWVLPLAVYLLSLMVAFSRVHRLIRWAAVATPAAVMLLWLPYSTSGAWPILEVLALELVGFGILATGLHGRLAQDRPHPAHLTDFYLTLTSGAALGSVLVAVVAPTLFPDLWEYPIFLVGALAGLAAVAPASVPAAPRRFTIAPFFSGAPGRVVPYILGAVLVGGGLYLAQSTALVIVVAWIAIGGLILLVGGRPWFLALSMAVFVVLAAFVLQPTEFRGRSWFGISRVLRSADSGLTVLVSGTTVHGSQWIDPAKHDTPTAYYAPGGPVEDIFAIGAPRRPNGATTVGVVGLGAGELSAYADAFTVMTWFEIDPVIVHIAQDPALFTYLADARGDPRIVQGDPRISLAAEADGAYHLLVLDAFSSNAVPVHLLTAEAIAGEIRALDPDGVIAFHISNRFYDLAPPIAAALRDVGFLALERAGGGGAPGDLPSRWLVASRNSDRVAAFRALGWRDTIPADHPFTDDYADLLSYLRLAP